MHRNVETRTGLPHAKFQRARLTRTELARARLARVWLARVRLPNAKLPNAGVTTIGACIAWSNFQSFRAFEFQHQQIQCCFCFCFCFALSRFRFLALLPMLPVWPPVDDSNDFNVNQMLASSSGIIVFVATQVANCIRSYHRHSYDYQDYNDVDCCVP